MIKLYVFLNESRQGCVGTDKLFEANALGEDGRIISYDVIAGDPVVWDKFVSTAAELASVVYDGPVEVIDQCEDPLYVEGFKAAVAKRRYKQDEPKRKAYEEAQRARQQEECIDRAVGRIARDSGDGQSQQRSSEGGLGSISFSFTERPIPSGGNRRQRRKRRGD